MAGLWLAGCLLNAATGATLLPEGSIGGHHFGYAVSVSGTTAAVGVRGSDAAFERSGAVQILEYQAQGPSSAWVKTKLLVPDSIDDPVSGTWFGERVAMSGDFVVVGSYTKVRIFERHAGGPGNWGQTHVFSPGGSFVLEGNRLLFARSGTASIYEKNANGVWVATSSFPNPSGEGIVAISGDTLATARYNPFMTGWVRVIRTPSPSRSPCWGTGS
jgi:hypothetical protein